MADNQTGTVPSNGTAPVNDPAPNNGPVIVADDDSVASSSTSLASSILQHRIENGRTYHKYKDGNLQHNIYLLTLDYKLGLAPPNDKDSGVKRVLDIGTGTGLWAIDFGEEHPEAECFIDLAGTAHADVVSGLAPGGYAEVFEGHIRPECDDGTLTPEHALSKWVDKIEECGKIFGRLWTDVPSLAPMMKEIGFVDVTIAKYKWPISPWAKDQHYRELGSWCQENFMEGLEGFTMAPFTRGLGWTREEVDVFLIDVRKDLKDRSIHAYSPMWTIYARRPLEEEAAE
ncbi:putative methyltransferase tdiE [Colletotrichum spaethianum]|uniref:Methyltransferase tdiE n=1 Tax=Colletotrichum spaethianum TaxID=700344 RepID=A0AA37P415_9PEZI|nr:putative methyltransferase tdiE [Colletotrichum spaethianum]GKT40041.1 putative methyltransferase tdiE [Colletotrichum spaethianum]